MKCGWHSVDCLPVKCSLCWLPVTCSLCWLPVTCSLCWLPVTCSFCWLPVTCSLCWLPVTCSLCWLPVTCSLCWLPVTFIHCRWHLFTTDDHFITKRSHHWLTWFFKLTATDFFTLLTTCHFVDCWWLRFFVNCLWLFNSNSTAGWCLICWLLVTLLGWLLVLTASVCWLNLPMKS